MTGELLAAFALFAVVSSITPGPNNMMVLASGANFGLRRTLPHLLGISLGFCVMVAGVGLGLGGVFAAYPILYEILRWVGATYLLYLAYKIATAGSLHERDARARPMTFLQAAAFQWVNPKAWAMALGAVTAYAPRDHYIVNVMIVALLFMALNLPCVSVWAGFGVGLRRLLSRPSALRAFNWTMAALLVLSLIPLLGDLAPA